MPFCFGLCSQKSKRTGAARQCPLEALVCSAKTILQDLARASLCDLAVQTIKMKWSAAEALQEGKLPGWYAAK